MGVVERIEEFRLIVLNVLEVVDKDCCPHIAIDDVRSKWYVVLMQRLNDFYERIWWG